MESRHTPASSHRMAWIRRAQSILIPASFRFSLDVLEVLPITMMVGTIGSCFGFLSFLLMKKISACWRRFSSLSLLFLMSGQSCPPQRSPLGELISISPTLAASDLHAARHTLLSLSILPQHLTPRGDVPHTFLTCSVCLTFDRGSLCRHPPSCPHDGCTSWTRNVHHHLLLDVDGGRQVLFLRWSKEMKNNFQTQSVLTSE